jgi:ribosomal 50S subunit-recycling heat shock protein
LVDKKALPWATRFYKTRSLAADAVSSGKVRVNGDRAKSAKEVHLGMKIQITNKEFEMAIEVIGLSNARLGAGSPTKRQLRDIAKFTGIKNYDGL